MSGSSTALRPVGRIWAIVIRSFAFLRKEVVEILRQPRLIALLVLGPFALLMLFGSGYAETTISKRTIFVGPAGSVYEDVLTNYEEQLSDFIDSQGMVPTVDEARAVLDAGDADVVVVFPENPEQAVLQGERAVIRVLHHEIDPLQQSAVEVAARLAIQEVNSTVLATVARSVQTEVESNDESIAMLGDLADALADDPVATREGIRAELESIDAALAGTETILDRLQLDEEQLGDVSTSRQDLATVRARLAAIDENTSDEELIDLTSAIQTLATNLDEVVILDPDVLVRPFESDTDNLVASSVTPTDYFTPASLALLLQHLALTFAALSLVRDRRTGLFELMRVGPLSSIEIITGKIFAYLLIGASVGAVLVSAAVFALGVPLLGSVLWLAVALGGVLLSSLALGMALAILSKTESQAVQYAMLALLAGLFFSGFILPIDGLSYPVRIISWLLPVTYGIDTTQDIMLRGVDPAQSSVLGLAALIALYGSVAVIGLRRQLRTGGES